MRVTKPLTLSEKCAEMDRRFQPFPNLSTAGSYTYFTQTIKTNGFDSQAFDRAFNDGDASVRYQLEPLLVHEFQHFDDHLLSVWGAGNLHRLVSAMNARASRDNREFRKITDIYRELREVNLTEYYSELYDGADEQWDGQTWAYQLSTGLKLDVNGEEQPDQPILFTVFANRSGKKNCSRATHCRRTTRSSGHGR